MNRLAKDFFRRDLSPSEERALLRALLRSEEEALRFSGEAAAFHARLGRASWRRRLASWLASFRELAAAQPLPAAGAALLLLGLLLGLPGIWRDLSMSSSAAAERAAPFRLSQALPAVRPLPGGPRWDGKLALKISLDSPRGLQVRILDDTGQVLRDLGRLEFPAGTRRLEWDGLLDGGVQAAPGSYWMEVDFGPGRVTRKLKLFEH